VIPSSQENAIEATIAPLLMVKMNWDQLLICSKLPFAIFGLKANALQVKAVDSLMVMKIFDLHHLTTSLRRSLILKPTTTMVVVDKRVVIIIKIRTITTSILLMVLKCMGIQCILYKWCQKICKLHIWWISNSHLMEDWVLKYPNTRSLGCHLIKTFDECS